jgi:Predicted acetyltransferase, GNAT superfamily
LSNATPSDAIDVGKLADSVDILVTDDPDQQGLLAANYTYTSDDYRHFIEIADYAFILRSKSDGKLIGFLVAYKSEYIDEKDHFNSYVRENICESFVTVRQVFVSPKQEHRRQGYGTLLYKELYTRILKDCERKGTKPRPIFADIVKTPVNVASRDFHFKAGFTTVGEMTRRKDNRQILIFCNNNIREALGKMSMI